MRPDARRAARPAHGERGAVIVWMALMLVLLLGSSAFAIDITGYHYAQSKEQRAADAAALAGAVYWPANGGQADTAAMTVAANNGYAVGSVAPFGGGGSCPLTGNATVAMCTGAGPTPNQYKVKIVRRVPGILGGILGIGSAVVGATAVGEYLKPLAMGSPSNQFGNDPDVIGSWPIGNPPPQTYPNFWANVAGGRSPKSNGDAYTAGGCYNSTTDGCSNGTNLDLSPGGYYYSVVLTSDGSAKLQAFDPAFVHVGDHCDDIGTTGLDQAATLLKVPFYPQGATNTNDIKKRYRPVRNAGNQSDPGFQYCTGDQSFDNGSTRPSTTYTILKATIPGDPGSAQPVAGCARMTFPGFYGNLGNPLTGPLATGAVLPGAPNGMHLSEYFRQWTTLCTVTGSAGDNYFIEVQTDGASQGHNRFAMRGVTAGGQPAAVNIYGNAFMGIYANAGAQLTQFYLARVPPAAAGHTLVLNFFDIGDASSPGTLQVVPPAEVVGTFSGCTWTGAPGFSRNTAKAPWGNDVKTPGSDCTITGVNVPDNTNWDGQWITVKVPIPTSYTCREKLPNGQDNPQGCFLRINYQFSGGLQDTTSWNAYLLGDPVRLVL